MTPQEAHEWIGVVVMGGLALALVSLVLLGVLAVAGMFWNLWKESRA